MDTLASSGIWTPWSQVLCRNCHDPDAVVEPRGLREGEPETEADYGEARCLCSTCRSPIWVRSDVGKIAHVGDMLNEVGEFGAALWQTGGMCSALHVVPRPPDCSGPEWPAVVLTAMDDCYMAGLYQDDDQWDCGEPTKMETWAWDADPNTVTAEVVTMLTEAP